MGVDPLTLSMIATGVSSIGSVMGTIGERSSLGYQARVAERNKLIEEQNAVKEMEASQMEGQDFGIAAGQQIAELISNRAASGTVFDLGSNAQIVAGQRSLAQRDQTRIRESGVASAQQRLQMASDYGAEAQSLRRRRRNTIFTGALDLGATYISGATATAKLGAGV